MDFEVIVSGVPVNRSPGVPLQVAFTAKPFNYWVKCLHPRSKKLGWWQRNDQQLRIMLKASKLNASCAKGDDLSEVDQAILYIIEHNQIDYAIRLAGYAEGYLHADGKNLLVTTSCEPMVAKEGEWGHLKTYVETLLGENVFAHQMGWWKWARLNLSRRDTNLPGQVMCYIGESGIGKSFLQRITTSLLGGHAGNPFNYMAGRSAFNADLFTCEHLVIEDQFADTAGNKRREFGAKLKELAVNNVVSCHGKGADAITLKPKWRVSMSMNDEPENLQVLPPLDDSVLDKLMLIKCRQPVLPVDLSDTNQWDKWDRIVETELPALAYAIDNYDIPQNVKSARYGVKPWHDRTLVEAEQETSVETQVLEIILNDLPVLTDRLPTWDGTSLELERALLGSGMPSVNQTRKLLSWRGAMGVYLGRIAKQHPTRVSKRKVKGVNTWRVNLK